MTGALRSAGLRGLLLLLTIVVVAVPPAAAQAETWSGSVTVTEDLRSMRMPTESGAADRIAGGFTLGVDGALRTDDFGNDELTASPSGASVTLTPTAYPQGDLNDPDCTWSRSWSAVAFNGASATVRLRQYAYDDAGERRDDLAEVTLYTGGPEGADALFGYDYVETSGYDDTCDTPYREDLPLFRQVLGNYSFQRSYTVPLTRDAEGRIYVRGTIERQVHVGSDLPNEAPMLAHGEGTQTVTVDLTGLPAGVPPPDQPPPEPCKDTAGGFTTREYSASAYPDLELFRFAPAVKYRFNATCVEIVQAWGSGFVDWGMDTYGLALLGFEVDYDAENVRFGVPSETVSLTRGPGYASALISGDFDVHFDYTALLGRLKFDRFTDKLEGWLTPRIERVLRKHGDVPDLFDRELRKVLRQEWIPKLKRKVITRFDRVLEAMPGPEFLRKRLAEHVLEAVNAKLDGLDAAADYTSGQNSIKRSSSWYAAEFVGKLQELFTGLLPNDFSIWSPDVRVTVYAGGGAAYDPGGFVNPFVSVELVPGSERTTEGTVPAPSPRAPREVADDATSVAAELLKRVGLFLGATGMRVPAEAGTLSMTVYAAGGGGTASAAARTVLARGRSTSSKPGWRTLRLKGTRALRRAGSRPRVTIVTRFTATSGRRSTKRLTARVRRAR